MRRTFLEEPASDRWLGQAWKRYAPENLRVREKNVEARVLLIEVEARGVLGVPAAASVRFALFFDALQPFARCHCHHCLPLLLSCRLKTSLNVSPTWGVAFSFCLLIQGLDRHAYWHSSNT